MKSDEFVRYQEPFGYGYLDRFHYNFPSWINQDCDEIKLVDAFICQKRQLLEHQYPRDSLDTYDDERGFKHKLYEDSPGYTGRFYNPLSEMDIRVFHYKTKSLIFTYDFHDRIYTL